ncbi:FtsB family cell division protein [Veillonella agrestimuris]|uniref:FtsB family cell division protein n=1 Tax=Veillonella agrestimuris TaxID=2941340 RepID=UPI00203A8C44|nr:septum formation initiator family protein [Veillonella agrestimuris]
MSEVHRTERRVPRKRIRRDRKKRDQAIAAVWIKRGLVIIMVFFLGFQAYQLAAIYHEKQQIEQQLQELRMQNDKLEEEKAKLQDPQAIEALAREELGLVKPGEVPYVK